MGRGSILVPSKYGNTELHAYMKSLHTSFCRVACSGFVYDGEWKNDKKCGRGKVSAINIRMLLWCLTPLLAGFTWKETSATGSIYDGGWKNDEKHGHGKNTFAPSGDVYEVST